MKKLVVLLALLIGGAKLFSCGPFFPNFLLSEGNEAVIAAPEAVFRKELERMKLVFTDHRAQPGKEHLKEAGDAELADLRAALAVLGMSSSKIEPIVERHRTEREKLRLLTQHSQSGEKNSKEAHGDVPRTITGLPVEFSHYFRGSIAWFQGDIATARKEWVELLQQKPELRRYKSTWAAYMLGKSWEAENREVACKYFQMVRSLATNGFSDSLGLAAASLGWEARLHYNANAFVKAIDLYLEHAATGDSSAIVSLRWTAAKAIAKHHDKLVELAAHPRAQRVITAYIISGGFRQEPIDVDSATKETALQLMEKASARFPALPAPKAEWHRFEEPAALWLKALEKSGIRDAESVEQIALAAYQAGQMDAAKRWLDRAQVTPVAKWLRAKLYLREGKLENAATLLGELCKHFPIHGEEVGARLTSGLAGSLYLQSGEFSRVTVGRQVRGELGVIRLARRQYVEALDALLQSGYWIDAAYVAERVLSLEELKRYVDRNWTLASVERERAFHRGNVENGANSDEHDWNEFEQPVGEQLRYLLARRLARAGRYNEARSYYPDHWTQQFDRLVSLNLRSRDMQLSQVDQAAALFEAALLMRRNGLELIGTECQPDWQMHGGNFEVGVTAADRSAAQGTNCLAASGDELARAAEHSPDPNHRWHYRWIASNLAWEAANLMKNGSTEKARALALGGTWLKNRDPKSADVFYKELVRTCRTTALGAEADRLRWFPEIDQEGELVRKDDHKEASSDGANLSDE